MRNLGVTLILSLALCAAGACGDDDDDDNGTTAGRDGGGSGGRSGSGGSGRDGGVIGGRGGSGGIGGDAGEAISDAEIAAALLAANSGEVEQGTIAVMRAQREDVQAFAQMMVSMHNAALDHETDLFKMISVTPVKGPDAEELETASNKIVQRLNSASASDFDAMYVGAQVDVHQKVLAMIDERLLPSVHGTELKNELKMVKDVVEGHLAASKQLLASLDELDGGIEGDAGL